ncbi:MAG: TatD family hydrolase [Chloroflexi bacterium]|nr:TatD family hydrolase [Chloroflexota bacterium]
MPKPFLADARTHLDQYPEEEILSVLSRARSAGVGLIIAAGTTLDSSRACLRLSEGYEDVFAGVGIHPMDLQRPLDQRTLTELRDLALSSRKVVVVSEVGLDFLKGAPDRDIQYQAFREQVRLAKDLGLPVVFHSREADLEVLRVLEEERAWTVGGAMHYFQGDEATARRCIELGFHISLAKPLLRLLHLQEVAKRLSPETVVLESDCYPQPFKKKRESWTEPRHVRAVAEKLAQLWNVSLENVAQATTGNLLSLLAGKGGPVAKEACQEAP